MINKITKHMSSIVLGYFCILACFAVLDGLWLGVLMASSYQAEMAGLLKAEFITWPWVVFYLVYGFVILVLTVISNRDKPIWYAIVDGALLGVASYGAYNLTNYSILEGFTLKIMIVDWIWGTSLSSLCAASGWIGFTLLKK